MYEKGNYRPISVIAHIAKICELQVQKQFLTYLLDNDYISIDQSAYRKCHSTQTALHRVTDDWLDNICDGLFTGVCCLDIKKCFDTIDHRILLKKLSYYGIHGKELDWFKSYLVNRAQVVKSNGKTSSQKFLNIGVPQGSVLGPILFMIYVNDLSQHVHLGTANLYADDTLIYCTGTTVSEVNSKLQKCVNEVFNWYEGNRLVLNASKSNTMLVASKYAINQGDCNMNINLNGCVLEQLSALDYLGVKIDDSLTWSEQILKMCKSISFKVSKLARLTKILPYRTVILLYNCFIQPSIDYAITIWGNTSATNLAKIQRLQNFAARAVTKKYDYINYRGIDIVHELGWMDVLQRHNYFQCILMFKSIHGMAPYYLTNNILMEIELRKITTRTHEMNVHLPTPSSEFSKSSFIYSAGTQWNNLPGAIKDCHSLDTFKKHLKTYIKSSL
jgi:hypothetical protein